MCNHAFLLIVLNLSMLIALLPLVTESANNNGHIASKKSDGIFIEGPNDPATLEGSGSGPETDAKNSDDEDFSGLPLDKAKPSDKNDDIDFSGDGPLSPHRPVHPFDDEVDKDDEDDEDEEEDGVEGSGDIHLSKPDLGSFGSSTKYPIEDSDYEEKDDEEDEDDIELESGGAPNEPVIEENNDNFHLGSASGTNPITHNDTKIDSNFSSNSTTEINKNNKKVDLEHDSNTLSNGISILGQKSDLSSLILTSPIVLTAVIGGTIVALLCAILVTMFCVYRMRKKDESTYTEPSKLSTSMDIYGRGSKYFDP